MVSRTYYVSNYTDQPGDGRPSLHRVELNAGPLLQDQMLVPGVEDLQIEYGIDTGSFAPDGVTFTNKRNGQVNTYVNASSVSAASWTNGSVIAAKIWLLMRSDRLDRDNISTPQTFAIAGADPVTFTDGYRRELVTSVVKLRNTQQLDKLQVGK